MPTVNWAWRNRSGGEGKLANGADGASSRATTSSRRC